MVTMKSVLPFDENFRKQENNERKSKKTVADDIRPLAFIHVLTELSSTYVCILRYQLFMICSYTSLLSYGARSAFCAY